MNEPHHSGVSHVGANDHTVRMMRSHAAACRRPLLGTLAMMLSLSITVAGPREARAQASLSRPSIFVREVRIDSLLHAFGVDTGRVRAAVVGALRDARRLATPEMEAVPALDVAVAVPLTYGDFPEPLCLIRVEVGRNLMEDGNATRLLWEGHSDLAAPTWRELGRGTLAEVLRVVNTYLRVRSGGP